MIRWILLSTLAAGLFYGLYCLLLRRDRWLQLSRIYLLFTLAFSLLYPLMRLPEVEMPVFAEATLPTLELTATPLETEPAAIEHETQRGGGLLQVVYLLGVALTLGVLVVQFSSTAMTTSKMPSRDGHLHLLNDDTPPHSFLNHIVVGTKGLGEEELQCIIAHERLHVSQWHTVDVLLMRLMCCIAWFNPFAWLYVRELRAVHEYLADGAVLAAHGRKGYLGLLYREATGLGYGHITNNFQSINIKKRIAMMNRKKTRFGAWKLLAALPVAAMLMLVGCKHAPTDETAEATVAENQPTELIDIANVDVNPEYPGGEEALYKYLSENISYPEAAKNEGVQGRVFVRFVVEADGSITDTEVLRGIGGGCDEEALRVISSMPNWTPAVKDGKAVRVQYTVPINFALK